MDLHEMAEEHKKQSANQSKVVWADAGKMNPAITYNEVDGSSMTFDELFESMFGGEK